MPNFGLRKDLIRSLRFQYGSRALFLACFSLLLTACGGGPDVPTEGLTEAGSSALLVSRSAGRLKTQPLQGSTLSGNAYVFVAARGRVDKVRFLVDGKKVKLERLAPYDLQGGSQSKAAPYDTKRLKNGPHELVAEMYQKDGRRSRYRADFTVRNTPKSAPPEPQPGKRWQPKPGTSWQWQLQGELDTSFTVDAYDIDLFDTSKSTIDALHRDGRKVVCYFSAGSFEAWRPDAQTFPAAVKGKKMDGWDELWLDVRKLDQLAPIMKARLELAAIKGCDAVEPDNVDGYANDTGVALSYQDQLAYNRFLASEAHKRDLSIGLKNDLEQIEDLEPDFDFAVNEECYQYDECDLLTPFVRAGKAVFGAEYDASLSQFCPVAKKLQLSIIKKRLDLGSYREACN